MARRPAVRPRRLALGDSVAVVSPSWGGPDAFPHVYDHGLAVLRAWGLRVVEYPSARATAAQLHAHPACRADDLNQAFANPDIRAVITSIGGDDSIRLLPLLDEEVIAANPKILLGYSDATTLLALVRRLGVVTFHGPSVMAGISQLAAQPPQFGQHVRAMLFEPSASYAYPTFETFTEGYPSWRDPGEVGRINSAQPAGGWHVLQGSGSVTGELFGGCLEVLDWIRGTRAWPNRDEWAGCILFVEPSEEKPGPILVERILRSFGVLGVFDGVVGIAVGRGRGQSADEAAAFRRAIVAVVAGEFGRPDLPIVANLPFGHTDPQWILPLGVRAEMNLETQTLRLVEPWLT
jgi:muramoyltetrapeptide carboxypeptidase LdcA involved in peptidoglycan recycling